MTNCGVYLQISVQSAKSEPETKGSRPPGTQPDDAFGVKARTDVTDAFVTQAASPYWPKTLKIFSSKPCDAELLMLSEHYLSLVCVRKGWGTCLFTWNSSICHLQPDTLARHWQGRVPLRWARVRDKTSKQSRSSFNKCGNFLEQQINADPGRERHPERGRVRLKAEGWRRGDIRIIQQQLSCVSLEQKSKEVEKVK